MIKHLLALAVLSTPAGASEFCTQLADTSKNIMVMRQAGTDPAALLNMTEDLPEDTKTVLKLIIEDAYSYPSVSMSASKVKVYDDFRNRWYIKCVKDSK